MTYPIENVPMPLSGWDRRVNPIAATLRALEIGQSILVPLGDRNWRDALVRNLNGTDKPRHWFAVREATGLRIYRDR